MLMIVFGAGASYDSSPRYLPKMNDMVDLRRPPLTSQFFEVDRYRDLMKNHQSCALLFSEIPDRMAEHRLSIEQTLEVIREDGQKYAHRSRQLLALRSYLTDVISTTESWNDEILGRTNYKGLIDEVEKWRRDNGEEVCFVTFNYDTLLDQACSDLVGMAIKDIGSYTAYPRYKLLKVHGSVNWLRRVENYNEESLEFPSEIVWTDKYEISEKGKHFVDDSTALIPAIAIPVASKSEFECPKGQLEVLAGVLPAINRLLVIGWRGAEEHFLEICSERIGKIERIQIVTSSNNGIEEVERNLRQKMDINGIKIYRSIAGFSGFVSGDGLRKFLYDPVP